MHKFLFTTALALIPLSAAAADLPQHAGPDRAVAPSEMQSQANWGGFYVGANVGAVWGTASEGLSYWKDNSPASYTAYGSGSHGSGIIGGIAAGYLLQNGSILYGAEIDTSLSSFKAEGQAANYDPTFGATDALTSSTKLNSISSGRIRLGYVANDWFFFATGGVALAHVQRTVHQLNNGYNYSWFGYGETNSFSNYRVGWTVGGGVEKAISNRITARVQYLYSDFGSPSYNYIGYPFTFIDTGSQKVRLNQSSLTAGIYYSFGSTR